MFINVEIKTLLYDILQAISEIEGFFIDTPGDFAFYQKDLRTKRTVERNIEIIGEAMNRILHKDATVNISNARQIIDTRNRIIDGYDTVSDALLRSVITQYIPVLKTEVEYLLTE